ncbi:MAG: hypothetical protein QXW98_04845 [Candidatus Caldarchaeum sp.]
MKKAKTDDILEHPFNPPYNPPEEDTGYSESTHDKREDYKGNRRDSEDVVPDGVERFFWSGVWWFKVGERLFDSLDKAIEELQNEIRRAKNAS